MHVNKAVLAVVEGGGGRATETHKEKDGYFPVGRFVVELQEDRRGSYSLVIRDGLVAAVTHAHLKLEAHERDGGTFGGTFAAHGLAALPAVVLRNTGRHDLLH